MTLFATLTAKDDNAAASPGSSGSSSSPPEAIQLHSDRVIDFLNGTTVHLLNSATGDANKSDGDGDGNNKGATNTNREDQTRYFSALSYQAIQTLQDDAGPISKSAGGTSASHVRPDLGVWDCRVNGNDKACAMLLRRVVIDKKKVQSNDAAAGEERKIDDADAAAAEGGNTNDNEQSPPIVMAIDLSNPTQVRPVLEQMRNVILTVHEGKEKATSLMPNPHPCTTSIKALQNSTFGIAKIQEAVAVKGGVSNDERIALILAAIVPSTSNTASSVSAAEEYKERQERALILYHLNKFCLEVDCTLVFVSEKCPTNLRDARSGEEKESKSEVTENDPLLGRNSAMSIDELGKVVRRVAMGLSPIELSDKAMEANEEDQKESRTSESTEEAHAISQQRPPSIHVPGSHDAELIHGAYLRNASCEGRWDASKDDLNVALPSNRLKNATVVEAKDDSKIVSSGDEEWLSQLASSIGLSPDAATATTSTTSSTAKNSALTPKAAERRMKEKTTMSKKRPVRAASSRHNKDAKPKDEKEVMNFFDNLLKK